MYNNFMKSSRFLLPCFLLIPGYLGAQISSSYSDKGPNLLISGKPFQAERVTRVERKLEGGIIIRQQVHETLARDAAGKVYDKSIQVSQQLSGGGTPATFFSIADLSAKHEISWNSARKNAIQYPLNEKTHLEFKALPPEHNSSPAVAKDKLRVDKQDLGAKTINGVKAIGTKTITTIPAGVLGNDRDIVSTEEQWLSDDLQLVVAETDISPFSGTRTVEVTSLKQKAPEDSLFVVPSDIEIKNSPMMNYPFGGPPYRPPPEPKLLPQ